MQLKVLGCSGGIGGGLRTTSFLLDDDILIDAGTGVGDLSIVQLAKIDHIFITHSHLDHIAYIPLLLDTVMETRKKPVTIYATAETQQALKKHLFNWHIWPDFSQIPSAHQPVMQYQTIELGEVVTLGGRQITALPANHVVPAVGYQVNSGQASWVFTGDTTSCPEFWVAANQIANLKYLIIETSYTNAESALAMQSKHLWPTQLLQDLTQLQGDAEVYITHLKPVGGEEIMQEITYACEAQDLRFKPQTLKQGQIFNF
ncbi:MAG TPA: 3',5'-cyclic-nucleotide phosphodiesterase [Methylophilaceae bacterium]|jgi:ribonuclease BN (tRNA processing enzyme)